jgi:hypothetical protein
MTKRSYVAITVALAGSVLGSVLVAQAQQGEPCPADMQCVVYQERTIEVDPSLGFYQALVWTSTQLVTTDIDGDKTRSQSIVLIGLVEQSDGTFKVDGTHPQAATGIYKDAEPGDVYTLAKSEQQDG